MTVERHIYLSHKPAALMEDLMDEDSGPLYDLIEEFAGVYQVTFKMELVDDPRHDPPLGHMILQVSCEGTEKEAEDLCGRLLHLVV